MVHAVTACPALHLSDPRDEGRGRVVPGAQPVAPGEVRQESHEAGLHRCRRRRGREVAEEADELSKALIAACGVGAHRPVERAGSTLPDGAVGPDEEVVRHVVPTLGRARVKGVDVTDEAALVRNDVRRCRVVHEQEANILGRQGTFGSKVCAPRRSRENVEVVGDSERPGRRCADERRVGCGGQR